MSHVSVYLEELYDFLVVFPVRRKKVLVENAEEGAQACLGW